MGAWACAHDLYHMIPGQQGRLGYKMKREKLTEERLSRRKKQTTTSDKVLS